VEKVLERFWNYLTIERGLRHTTARGYVRAVRPFLYDRVLPDDVGLRQPMSSLLLWRAAANKIPVRQR
jgi:hypothetical protein